MQVILLCCAAAAALFPHSVAAQDAAEAEQPAPPPADGDDYHGEIVVSAGGLNRLDMLAGTSVLGSEELQRNQAGQIGDVLAKVPGVSATSFSPGASRPVLRGFSGDRVRVLVDGIGSIDASNTSADHAVTIDPLTAERIEVLRGPATLLYGSSAIGGAVNVIDKRIPRRAGHEPVHFDGTAAADTAYDLREVGASVDTPVTEQLAFHVDGSWRRTDDVGLAGGGKLPDSATETKSYGSGLAWIGSSANLGVSIGRYETDYGVPTPPGGEEDISIGLRQTRYDLRGGLDLGSDLFSRADTRWGYSDYTHTEFEGDEPGTVFDVSGIEGRLELVQRERGGWRGSLGGQYFQRDLTVTGDEAFVPPNRTEQWALFTLQEIEVGDFELEFGGRYEDTAVSAPARERDFGTLSGALGLSWTSPEGLRFGLNGSRTERAPTAEELFADGPHLATQQYELGNPMLGKESAWGLEGYVRGDVGQATLGLAIYHTWFDDFVYLAATGAEIDDLPVYSQSQQAARWFGIEGEASVPLFQGGGFTIVADGKADYVRATLADGDPVPRIPPLSLLGAVEFQSEPFDVRAELEWVAAQDRIAPYETPTDGWTTANLSLAWKPLRGFDNVTVMLIGDNLFDVTRRRHSSFTKDFVPLAGRNVKLSVKVSL